jgi:hypothetical protein
MNENEGNRTSRAVIIQFARDSCKEMSVSEKLPNEDWCDYFLERHKASIGLGVLSKGETKASIPPNYDESLRFVESLSNLGPEEKKALENGMALSLDEMGVPLNLRDTLNHNSAFFLLFS